MGVWTPLSAISDKIHASSHITTNIMQREVYTYEAF